MPHAGVPPVREGAFAVRYILTIKALHELDPTGLTLSAIGDPIRKYLRERKDTVRCIVEGACRVLPTAASLVRTARRHCGACWEGLVQMVTPDRAFANAAHGARERCCGAREMSLWAGLAVRLPRAHGLDVGPV